MNRIKDNRISQDRRKIIEEILEAPFEEIVRVAVENLRRVGCSEKGIDTVVNDVDGIIGAFENDFSEYQRQCFGTDSEIRAIYILTTC